MAIVDRINRDLADAMKARDLIRLSALRMAKTALKLRETELPGAVDDAEAFRVLNTLLKQRREAADQYRAAGREDRALDEEGEAEVLRSYLPAAATKEEMSLAVREAITETGASSMADMGKAMGAARAKLKDKSVDGKALSDLVKAALADPGSR